MPVGAPKKHLRYGGAYRIIWFLGVYIAKLSKRAPNIDMMKCWAEIC